MASGRQKLSNSWPRLGHWPSLPLCRGRWSRRHSWFRHNLAEMKNPLWKPWKQFNRKYFHMLPLVSLNVQLQEAFRWKLNLIQFPLNIKFNRISKCIFLPTQNKFADSISSLSDTMHSVDTRLDLFVQNGTCRKIRRYLLFQNALQNGTCK